MSPLAIKHCVAGKMFHASCGLGGSVLDCAMAIFHRWKQVTAHVDVHACRNVEFKQPTVSKHHKVHLTVLLTIYHFVTILHVHVIYWKGNNSNKVSSVKTFLKLSCNSRRKQTIRILKNIEHLVCWRWVRGFSVILRSNLQGRLFTPLLIDNYFFTLSHNHLLCRQPRAIEQERIQKTTEGDGKQINIIIIIIIIIMFIQIFSWTAVYGSQSLFCHMSKVSSGVYYLLTYLLHGAESFFRS
jgi:hypothetical protein